MRLERQIDAIATKLGVALLDFDEESSSGGSDGEECEDPFALTDSNEEGTNYDSSSLYYLSCPSEAKIGKNKISFLVPQIRDWLRSHDCPQHNNNSKICLDKVLGTKFNVAQRKS